VHIGIISKVNAALFDFVNIVFFSDSLDDDFGNFHAFGMQVSKCKSIGIVGEEREWRFRVEN